jgi:hypothetical protein
MLQQDLDLTADTLNEQGIRHLPGLCNAAESFEYAAALAPLAKAVTGNC